MTKDIYDLTDPFEIARYIKEAEKKTTAKAYISGDLSAAGFKDVKKFGSGSFWVLIGEAAEIQSCLRDNADKIADFVFEDAMKNSAVPMLDLTKVDARVEPGAIIRNGAVIGRSAVIMMGAVINIGAVVGEGTMVDMNAVLGARAMTGKRCHIGAGAVIAGVLEPPSAEPVVIGDDVMIGANAVVLEGCHIGDRAVVAAGAVVTGDIPAGAVAAGMPAGIVKERDSRTAEKTQIMKDLRR